MDKIAANNHFVILKKEIKKAKAMVSGKLIRRIKELKKEIDGAEDETKVSKIQSKIGIIHGEIKLLKTLDSYPIAKQATLRPNKEHWNKLASHSKATPGERLTALVICKNNIQKQVSKFRDEHKDCDEWLEEYIEYREKKNELVKPRKQYKNGKKTILLRPKESRKTSKQSDVEKPIDRSKQSDEEDTLHPSWESKRKEKELLKAAFSGKIEQPKRITFE